MKPVGYEGVSMARLWHTHIQTTRFGDASEKRMRWPMAMQFAPSDICLNSIDLFWQMCEVFHK